MKKATAKKAGCKGKYSPVVVRKICSYLKKGNTQKVAALLSGIAEDTFYDWMVRFPEFSESIKRAEAEAEESKVKSIKDAEGEGTWQAAAWWLERRRRSDYALKNEVDIGNKDGKPFQVEGTLTLEKMIEKMRPDEVEAELARIRALENGAGEETQAI